MTSIEPKFHERVFSFYLCGLASVVLAGRTLGYDLSSLEELFWPAVACFAVVLLLLSGKIEFPKRMFFLVSAFVAMMGFKAIIGFLGHDELFGSNGFFLEFKFIVFAVISLIVCTAFPVIDARRLHKYFLFFAALEIVAWLIQAKIKGGRTVSLLSEQNYDGVVILIGYVLVLKEERLDWRKIAFLFLATVCTSSRTGLLSFVVLSVIRFRTMKNRFLYWLLILGMSAVALIVFLRRLGSLRIESIDRFVMLMQFVSTMKDLKPGEYLWGTIPGIPLMLVNKAMNYYINRQNVPLGLQGLHPFNFHGFFMRFILSFGPLAFLVLGVSFFKEAAKEKWKSLLLVLVLTQMFSLGVFYLTVMAVPLWVLIFTRSQGEEIARSPNGAARA